MAATGKMGNSSPRCRLPWAASRPAVRSRLSPGRKKPKKSPDSAKMMANSPM